MAPEPKRILILSGGGGRGAFHAGVYQYLMSKKKAGVDAAHAGPWVPSIVVGTSIGAVNGAAIAQGMSAQELVKVWKTLEENDIQGLPPRMRGLARWIAGKLFGELMDAKLKQVPLSDSTSPRMHEFWPPLPLLPAWLAERLVGKWVNLLDTGPLRRTLVEKFKFDQEKLNASETALIITATKVETGERVIFSNQPIRDPDSQKQRKDVLPQITLSRILASCSIPLVYPWTKDEETGDLYWDGALVANTPLGAALDKAFENLVGPVEVVVVMMTPWTKSDETDSRRGRKQPALRKAPRSFGAAVTWMLDWMLLASFRENLKTIQAYNKFAKRERETGQPPYRYQVIEPIIVAPASFINAERIIDYDGDESARLIRRGAAAARKAFQKTFAAASKPAP